MKRYSRKYVAGFVVVFLLGGLLFSPPVQLKLKAFNQYAQVDVKQHLRIVQQFEQLRQQDTLINQYLLQTRYQLLKNYDPIVSSQLRATAILDMLQRDNPDYFGDGYPQIRQEFIRYRALFGRKLELIEHFKSHNAVLHNSLAYFPLAIRTQLAGVPTNSLRYQLLHDLSENILIYEHSPTDKQKLLVKSDVAALRNITKSTDASMLSLIRHVDVILTHQQEVDALVKEITQSETALQAEKLFKLYGELFTYREERAALYKLGLALFSVVLMAYVALVLVRLKRARNRLAQSLRELEFEKFALDQHSIVSVADRSGKIIYTNDRFSQISQYRRDELLGQDHRVLNSGYHSREFFQDMWATIIGGKVWHGEVKNRRKDGSYYWVESTIVPFMDEHNHPLRYVSIRTDITASKAMHEQMLLQRAFYERISETLGEGLYVQDADGRCIYMNAEAEKLLGWSREEFIGKPVHDTIHTSTSAGDHLPAHDCPIMLWVYANGEAHMDNQVFARKDGTTFPVSLVSKASYAVDGGIESMVVSFQDITARKEAEALVLQAKEAAEQASRVKGDFLANMSHEIRTPMNGIIGMTDLALDTDLSNEQREYIGLVKSSADALLNIINDILDFSKIESGKMDIEIIEFSLEVMLRDTIKTLAVRAHEKQLELLLHVAPDVPDRLMGDPGRLRQVIVNLVGNAIKFTDVGEVEVDVQRLKILPEGQVQLQFSVRDTGIGIPRQKFQTIFESFSQADTSTTRKYGGTGLGLTISAQIIKLMGGQLDLDSEVGKGTTFHFSIDMTMVADSALAQYQNVHQISGMPVLVADDNATNRQLLQEMLLNLKLRPVVVSSGEEAVEEFGRAANAGEPYALSILDVQMPGMDGFELAEHMRKQPNQECATLMMLTSEGQRGDAARCRELGIASYLMKPISQSDLFDAIMTVLGGGSSPSVAPLVTRHSLRETRPKLNLLLAEDNAVNQTLAIRLLERLGHEVTLANNGVEAVSLWKEGQFDAVLMDIDMPLMSGYEATQVIRELESSTGRQHVSIIAMTAHAMQGMREECMRHGMDGYVSKPIDTEALWRELEHIEHIATGNVFADQSLNDIVVPVVADFSKARETMDDNRELFDEIVRLFFAEVPPYMQQIKDAITHHDSGAVRHGAHAIKGMVSVFAAERTIQVATKVEQYADQPEQLVNAVVELDFALSELKIAISDYQW